MNKEHILVQIGKNGINNQQIMEIKKNLKAGNKVKVKMLKSYIDTNDKNESKNKIISELEPMRIKQKLVGNTLFLERQR